MMLPLRCALLLMVLSAIYVKASAKAIEEEDFVLMSDHDLDKSANASQPDDQPKVTIATDALLEKNSASENPPAPPGTTSTTENPTVPPSSSETITTSNEPSTSESSTEKPTSSTPSTSSEPSSSTTSDTAQDASSTPSTVNPTTPSTTTTEQEPKAPEPSTKDGSSGTVALIMAITFAITVIIVYFGLLAWRRYLEWRYGNRELLVNDLEFDTNDLRHFEL